VARTNERGEKKKKIRWMHEIASEGKAGRGKQIRGGVNLERSPKKKSRKKKKVAGSRQGTRIEGGRLAAQTKGNTDRRIKENHTKKSLPCKKPLEKGTASTAKHPQGRVIRTGGLFARRSPKGENPPSGEGGLCKQRGWGDSTKNAVGERHPRNSKRKIRQRGGEQQLRESAL